MSIQAGIWNCDGQPVTRQSLEIMSSATAEYGPDGEGLHLNANIGMLYRPFHTTSESVAEKQPYVFNGRSMLWDGRLDNRSELFDQLQDCQCDLHTNVAIVAAAYDRWGTDCFARLTGDWAVSIWDPRENELILARDYIGIRQLFYRLGTRNITWCTQLNSLLLTHSNHTLCNEYVADYLVLRLQSHLTPFSEIRAVPAGSFVRVRDCQGSLHPYWTFKPQFKTRYKTDAEYEDHFRHLFRQAVARRLRSSARIVADLSGGFDSSSIVCMADEISKSDSAGTPPVDTFSYNYNDEPDGNDLKYIHAVEKRRGRVGHHAEIRGCGESFSLDHSTLAAGPVFGARREVEIARSEAIQNGSYRVTLSGFGGDEFLGQALQARVQLADLLIQLRFGSFLEQMMAWSVFWKRPFVRLLFETLAVALPTPTRRQFGRTRNEVSWLNSRFARNYNLFTSRLSAVDGAWSWLPSARDWFQTRGRIAGILTSFPPAADERRYPFLDQSLTEFLASIPVDQLLRPGERRSLMRRALARIVPNEILSRRTKQMEARGYVVTLRKHWEALQPVITAPVSSQLGYIKADEFRAALAALKNGQLSSESMMVLRALFLEQWLRSVTRHKVVSISGLAAAGVQEDVPKTVHISASRSA